MKYQITKNKLKIEIDFNPKDWWLFNEKGIAGEESLYDGIWYLSRKIDRSYKGKIPDIAVPTLMIDDEKLFEALKKVKGLDRVWR